MVAAPYRFRAATLGSGCFSWQRKNDYCIRSGRPRIVQRAEPGRYDRYVLPSILALIRDRNRMSAVVQLSRPQFLAGFRIERAEPPVIGRADKYQPAGRRDRATHIIAAGIPLALRQIVSNSQRDLPREISRSRIHRDQPSPWWLLAGPRMLAAARHVTAARIAFRPLKSRGRSQHALAIERHAGSFRLLFHPPNAGLILRIHENVAQLRIGRHAAPIRPADRSR